MKGRPKTDLLDQVLNVIAESNGITTTEIKNKVGFSFTAVLTACKTLQKAGHISLGEGYYYNKQGGKVTTKVWFEN